MHTILRSASKEVVIGDDQPFCIIGERINPTGRKLFQEQLRADDLSRITIDVAQQIAGGAMVLDVNMGVPLADEVDLMIQAVTLIQSHHRPAAVHRLLGDRGPRGRTGDVRGQGPGQLGDGRGRPPGRDLAAGQALRGGDHRAAQRRVRDPLRSPSGALELTRKIVDVATTKYGIAIEDILIDPLAMPIGADTSLVVRTLETISMIHEEFGLNMTLGASNVSFGMPDRGDHWRHVPAHGHEGGPHERHHGRPSAPLVRAIKATDLLLDRDPWGATWIAAHRAQQAAEGFMTSSFDVVARERR
jgi:5-methyltetrahydrofolate--homocysteine methyltransferase